MGFVVYVVVFGYLDVMCVVVSIDLVVLVLCLSFGNVCLLGFIDVFGLCSFEILVCLLVILVFVLWYLCMYGDFVYCCLCDVVIVVC